MLHETLVWKPYKGPGCHSDASAELTQEDQLCEGNSWQCHPAAHISQHPCQRALYTWVSQIHQAQLHLKFFLVISLLNDLQWESHLWAQRAANQSGKITSLWKAHLSMRHPSKELSFQKNLNSTKTLKRDSGQKMLASFWSTHLSKIFLF